MKPSVWSGCFLLVACAFLVGCGGPDPKKNPDFNEKALKDPSSLKMGVDATKPQGGTGPGMGP